MLIGSDQHSLQGKISCFVFNTEPQGREKCILVISSKCTRLGNEYEYLKTENHLENGIPGGCPCNVYESFLIEPVINLFKHQEVWNIIDTGF